MIPGFSFAKEVYEEFSRDNCSRMAAALAYYTIFSMAPLTALVLMLSGLLYEPGEGQTKLSSQLTLLLTDQGAEQVQAMAANARQHPVGIWGSIVGLGMLIYGATYGISELQAALNTVWKVPSDADLPESQRKTKERGFLLKRAISFGMIFLIALLLLASIVFSTIVNAVGDRLPLLFPDAASKAMLTVMQLGSSFVVITILFAILYKFLPDVNILWRDVWLGALLTGFLFMLGKSGLEFYLGQRDLKTVYGAAGTFVGILLWVNYAALIFLFGAEWTQVWSRRRKAK